MTVWEAATLCLVAAAIGGQSAAPPAPALERMVATERAFAKLGAEKGARESFLVYFADEAVNLDEAEPRPAKAAIRQWAPARAGTQLLWEPRTGAVAASGDLGYLTGPVVRVTEDGARHHACYMSVWKKQADGSFKVVLDFGSQTPGPAAFADGFAPGWTAKRYQARGGPTDARRSLEQAEQALAREAGTSVRSALARCTSADTRLYRDGIMPLVGAAAISEWALRQPVMATTVRHVEVAESGDLGYAWGSYEFAAAGGKAQKGHFVRVWGREADGGWRVLIDVAQEVR